jgi:Domain of unknown function (DUF4340)
MSKAGVIVALVMAVALAVAAAIVLGPQTPTTTGGPLLPVQPSQIVAIHVNTVAGRDQSIEREIRGGWVFVADDGGRWPIDRTAIDNALRLLVALNAEREGEGGDGGDDWKAWPGFDVTLETNEVWRLRCEPTVIGGSRSVHVRPPDDEAFTARVEGEILTALIETGVGAWRIKRALPDVSPDTTRIRLESPSQTVQLVRRGGRWRLIEPVAVAADDAKAQMLLRYLAGVEVNRFVASDADRASLGLDDPISVAVLEREIVSGTQGNMVRKTERRRLVVGGAADVAASRFSAEVTRTLVGPDGTVEEKSSTIVEVTAKSLGRIVSAPTPYVSRRVAEVAAANVGAITIRTLAGDVRFDKTIDGWFRREVDAETAATPPRQPEGDRTRVLIEGERRLAALLGQLCETDARSVGIGTRVDAQELCEITLGSLGGQPLETMTLSTTGPGEIIAIKGEVYWVLAGNLDEVLSWLLEQADTNGPGGG